jgi:putative lipoic acid-binding regulatory protein
MQELSMQPPPEEEENSEELEAAYQQLELEQQQLTEDDMECTARVVTELVESGNAPLPDRFMFAMRAIRGEFTPPEGATDTDRAEDAITSALMQFPATIPLRVVTRPITESAYAELSEQLVMMLTTLEGAEAAGVTMKERPGQRRSIEFSVKVPDAGALSMLREALKEDDRVQMVF